MSTPYATLLTPKQYRSMPWKNGQGVTEEIALAPPEVDLASKQLLWRLSRAPILATGSFSSFPGLERLLTLVEGKTLGFNRNGKRMILKPGDIYQFSGDEKVEVDLPAGPVKDLGLLFRKEKVQAEMELLEFAENTRSFRMQARTNFFYCVQGIFSAHCFPLGLDFRLEGGMALRVDEWENERVVLLEPHVAKGQLVTLELWW